MGYNSWGCKESYMAEQLTLSLSSLDKLVNCFPGDTFAASAAATKLRQSCPTLCDPIDGSPPGSSVPGLLQTRTLEWVAISFSNA